MNDLKKIEQYLIDNKIKYRLVPNRHIVATCFLCNQPDSLFIGIPVSTFQCVWCFAMGSNSNFFKAVATKEIKNKLKF